MNYQHKTLAEGRWAQMSLAEQMLNIGSEISRANKWMAKGNDTHCKNAAYRALELISLTIDAQKNVHSPKEFTRLFEVVADLYLGDNVYHSEPDTLQKYFDKFAYGRKAINTQKWQQQ